MDLCSDRFIDLRLYQSGQAQYKPGHSIGPSRERHYLFHYIVAGSGTLHWKDASGRASEETIDAGEGFLLYPDQVASYTADVENPWNCMWIEFDGLRVLEALQDTDFTPDTPVYRAHSMERQERMVQEMRYLCADDPDPQIYCVIAHMYLFMAYLTESARSVRTARPERVRDHYVRTALDFIEENYTSQITVEDIAAQCGIDRSHFGKIFHDVIGQSPRRFLLQYRMTRAASLLHNTDLSVADIGAAVGYENPLHFSRAFKNVHGICPTEWRTSHRRTERP